MKGLMGNRPEITLRNGALALLLTLSMSQGVFAQDDLLDETDDILNSEQIDIDGNFKRKTKAQKLEEMRKKLERQNEQMVQKRIEDMRMKEEQKLTRKLRKAFNGQAINTGDSVSTISAAPQKTVAPAPAVEEENNIRVIPSFGVLNYSGEEGTDLESEINGTIAVEAKVSNRFVVGVGFSYTTMEIMDLGNGGFGSFNYNGFLGQYQPSFGLGYQFNPSFYGPQYQAAFGQQGREMEYRNMALELSSKFFIIPDSKIRPYIGLGLSYNRARLRYTDGGQGLNGQQFQFNTFNLGDEQFNANYVAGSAVIGAEVLFTKNIGMNLDLRYTKSLTEGFSTDNANTFMFNPDQEALEVIGQDIHGSNVFGLSAGLLVTF